MLLKPALFNPSARCCWECRHGNGGEPSKRKTIICDVDGAVTFHLVPGFCPSFAENERGAKARQRKAGKSAA